MLAEWRGSLEKFGIVEYDLVGVQFTKNMFYKFQVFKKARILNILRILIYLSREVAQNDWET